MSHCLDALWIFVDSLSLQSQYTARRNGLGFLLPVYSGVLQGEFSTHCSYFLFDVVDSSTSLTHHEVYPVLATRVVLLESGPVISAFARRKSALRGNVVEGRVTRFLFGVPVVVFGDDIASAIMFASNLVWLNCMVGTERAGSRQSEPLFTGGPKIL